jgi:hypothetical protein
MSRFHQQRLPRDWWDALQAQLTDEALRPRLRRPWRVSIDSPVSPNPRRLDLVMTRSRLGIARRLKAAGILQSPGTPPASARVCRCVQRRAKRIVGIMPKNATTKRIGEKLPQ